MHSKIKSIPTLKWMTYLFISILFSCNSDPSQNTLDTDYINNTFQEKLKQVKILQDSFKYDEAIDILQELRQHSGFSIASDSLKSNLYHKYGLMLFKKEKYHQSVLQLDTAIIIRTKLKKYRIEHIANSYYLRGQAKIHIKDEEALADIQRAIDYFELKGDPIKLLKCYIFKAVALQDRGDFEQAERYYQKILNETIIEEGSQEMALLYSNLGVFYGLQNELLKQRKALQKALDIYKRLGKAVKREYFATAIIFGTSFLYQGDWKGADNYFIKLLNELKSTKENYATV